MPGMPRMRFSLLIPVVYLAGACRSPERASVAVDTGPASASAIGLGHKPSFIGAPPGAVDEVVRQAQARATLEGKRLVVYDGAPWCDPCRRFHEALQSGQLDEELPSVTFLEFDNDRDRERLIAAGYKSVYIPLFALPGPDGRSSRRQVEGGSAGEGAATEIAQRLSGLLASAR